MNIITITITITIITAKYGGIRDIFVTFKLKVEYKIGGYVVFNHVNPRVSDQIAEHRKHLAESELWIDAPIIEKVKVIN